MFNLQKNYNSFYGSVAQLVEQKTLNLLVAGSNPARSTKFYLPIYEKNNY